MSSAVYQPTTVTYESNNEHWQDRPISYLASTVTDVTRRPCGISCSSCRSLSGLSPVILITGSITCFIIGVVLLTKAIFEYSGLEDNKDEGFHLGLTLVGALFLSVSILLFIFFLKTTRRWCWSSGKDHLDIGNQALNVNPSTDFLVTAQYAPVSEVAYQPALEDEQSKLMPQDINKDLMKDDTDCMVESDPRIVLRPLTQPSVHEET